MGFMSEFTTFEDLHKEIDRLPWKDDMSENRKSEYTSVDITKRLALRKNKETPDFQELLLEGDNLVFVYGTLKPGGSNHDLLRKSKWLGEGITLSDNYILRSGGGFPTVKQSASHLAGKVCGDVFAVDVLTMCELDRLEGNNTLYTRKKKFITLLDQEYKLQGGKTGRPNIECWMYLIPESDESFDGNWLGPSRMRSKNDGTSVRLYDWDATTARSLYNN